MTTFTDLSQSTQAGDPVVSTLTSGLDRNQIAAFRGDSTATPFLQAEKNAFPTYSISTPKIGDQSANLNSLSPIYSSGLFGVWGGWAGTTSEPDKTDNPFISRRFNKAGKYRIYCTMKITASAGEPIDRWGKATIVIIKNNTTRDWQSPGGTKLAESDEVETQGNVVTIDTLITVEKGDKITLLGSNYDVIRDNLFMSMSYKVFAEYPSYASPTDVGIVYNRYQVEYADPLIIEWNQQAYAVLTDWTSSPIPGDLPFI